MKSQILKFKDMPFEFQRSLIIYGGEDGTVDWTEFDISPIEDECTLIDNESEGIDWIEDIDTVKTWIDDYSKVYADRKFRVGTISIEEVKEKVIQGNGFDDFDEYHEWFGDNTDHGNSVFPIVTSKTKEYIEDGWHRFHSYVRKGLKEIPFVEYI